jgi:hypothetical protein
LIAKGFELDSDPFFGAQFELGTIFGAQFELGTVFGAQFELGTAFWGPVELAPNALDVDPLIDRVRSVFARETIHIRVRVRNWGSRSLIDRFSSVFDRERVRAGFGSILWCPVNRAPFLVPS